MIICGFGISHTEEKSSYISMHSYLSLFLKCHDFDSKNHQFLNKKNHPNAIRLFPKYLMFFFFFCLVVWGFVLFLFVCFGFGFFGFSFFKVFINLKSSENALD